MDIRDSVAACAFVSSVRHLPLFLRQNAELGYG